MLPGYELPARTRLFCRLLKWFSVVFAIVHVVMFFITDPVGNYIVAYWDELSQTQKEIMTYSDLKKRLLQSVVLLSGGSYLLVLLAAYRLFAELQKGAALSLPVAKAIRFVGIMVMIALGISLMIHPLMLGIMTYDLPQGDRTLSIALRTHHAQTLVLGALFLIIGQIFTQAVRISDENRQIV